MATLAEIRQQYPDYGDLTDTALADALYGKFYSDVPRAEFDAKIGLQATAPAEPITAETASPGSEEAAFLASANATQPAPEELAMRGSVLPIGRTKEGEATLALPEFLEGPRKTIADLLDGKRTAQQLTGREIFDLGALFAGGGGSARLGITGAGERTSAPAAPRAAEAVAPAATTEEFRTAAKSFYKQADDANVVLSPESVKPLAQDIFQTLSKEGLDPTLHPRTTAALKRITEASDEPLSFQTLETLRKVARAAGKGLDKDEGRLSGEIIDKIDDYIAKLSDKDVAVGMAGDAEVAAKTIVKARDLWSRVAKLDTVADLVERASISAPNFSASGLENALKTEFRALAKNKRAIRTFNAKEQKAIKKVARGTVISKAARNVGRFAPTGPVSAGLGIPSLAAAGAAIGGPMGAAAAAGGGAVTAFAARKLATILIQRHIKQLEGIIKSGGESAMAQESLRRANLTIDLLTGKAGQVSAAQVAQD